jgi:phosphoenolpyruvate synthase/pyruvate phosphate dikinase
MELLWLSHTDCHYIDRADAKAAHLSRLASSYSVPAGFCIAAEAYSRWAELIDSGPPASPPEISSSAR